MAFLEANGKLAAKLGLEIVKSVSAKFIVIWCILEIEKSISEQKKCAPSYFNFMHHAVGALLYSFLPGIR